MIRFSCIFYFKEDRCSENQKFCTRLNHTKCLCFPKIFIDGALLARNFFFLFHSFIEVKLNVKLGEGCDLKILIPKRSRKDNVCMDCRIPDFSIEFL